MERHKLVILILSSYKITNSVNVKSDMNTLVLPNHTYCVIKPARIQRRDAIAATHPVEGPHHGP